MNKINQIAIVTVSLTTTHVKLAQLISPNLNQTVLMVLQVEVGQERPRNPKLSDTFLILILAAPVILLPVNQA